MSTAVEAHCETARDSPYSRDRQEAIEELRRLYPDVSTDEQRRILETLREVASNATATDERSLARQSIREAFDIAPAVGASIVVPLFCEQARNASHSDDRLDAIDSLRELYGSVDESERDEIEATLAEVASEATFEDERRRARQRLSDVQAETERSASDESDEDSATDSSMGYLGQSLAEHLSAAADDSPEACRQRAEELRDFVVENPVDDESYDDVVEGIESLTEQLSVLRGDDLDTERVDRVRRVANRVERLYSR